MRGERRGRIKWLVIEVQLKSAVSKTLIKARLNACLPPTE